MPRLLRSLEAPRTPRARALPVRLREEAETEPLPSVGQRLSVLWPKNGEWYDGTVFELVEKKKRNSGGVAVVVQHRIAYDNGELELVELSGVSWRKVARKQTRKGAEVDAEVDAPESVVGAPALHKRIRKSTSAELLRHEKRAAVGAAHGACCAASAPADAGAGKGASTASPSAAAPGASVQRLRGCASCSTTQLASAFEVVDTSAFNLEHGSLRVCGPCGARWRAREFCPICAELWDVEAVDMVQCEQCELWVHAGCDGLSPVALAQLENTKAKYVCPGCDPHPAARALHGPPTSRGAGAAPAAKRAKMAAAVGAARSTIDTYFISGGGRAAHGRETKDVPTAAALAGPSKPARAPAATGGGGRLAGAQPWEVVDLTGSEPAPPVADANADAAPLAAPLDDAPASIGAAASRALVGTAASSHAEWAVLLELEPDAIVLTAAPGAPPATLTLAQWRECVEGARDAWLATRPVEARLELAIDLSQASSSRPQPQIRVQLRLSQRGRAGARVEEAGGETKGAHAMLVDRDGDEAPAQAGSPGATAMVAHGAAAVGGSGGAPLAMPLALAPGHALATVVTGMPISLAPARPERVHLSGSFRALREQTASLARERALTGENALDRLFALSVALAPVYGPLPQLERPWATSVVGTLIGLICAQNTRNSWSSVAYANFHKAFPPKPCARAALEVEAGGRVRLRLGTRTPVEPDWDSVRQCVPVDIEPLICHGPYFHIKAERIIGFLKGVHNALGKTDLEAMDDAALWPTERVRAFLMAFPGISRKSISCLVLYRLRRLDFAIDANVLRIMARLGWLQPIGADPVDALGGGARRVLLKADRGAKAAAGVMGPPPTGPIRVATALPAGAARTVGALPAPPPAAIALARADAPLGAAGDDAADGEGGRAIHVGADADADVDDAARRSPTAPLLETPVRARKRDADGVALAAEGHGMASAADAGVAGGSSGGGGLLFGTPADARAGVAAALVAGPPPCAPFARALFAGDDANGHGTDDAMDVRLGDQAGARAVLAVAAELAAHEAADQAEAAAQAATEAAARAAAEAATYAAAETTARAAAAWAARAAAAAAARAAAAALAAAAASDELIAEALDAAPDGGAAEDAPVLPAQAAPPSPPVLLATLALAQPAAGVAATAGPPRVRRQRCGVCAGCAAADCGACAACRDKPRFGGPGLRKAVCIARACAALRVPPPPGSAAKPRPPTAAAASASAKRAAAAATAAAEAEACAALPPLPRVELPPHTLLCVAAGRLGAFEAGSLRPVEIAGVPYGAVAAGALVPHSLFHHHHHHHAHAHAHAHSIGGRAVARALVAASPVRVGASMAAGGALAPPTARTGDLRSALFRDAPSSARIGIAASPRIFCRVHRAYHVCDHTRAELSRRLAAAEAIAAAEARADARGGPGARERATAGAVPLSSVRLTGGWTDESAIEDLPPALKRYSARAQGHIEGVLTQAARVALAAGASEASLSAQLLRAHVYMITHGAILCAEQPACAECPLAPDCAYALAHLHRPQPGVASPDVPAKPAPQSRAERAAASASPKPVAAAGAAARAPAAAGAPSAADSTAGPSSAAHVDIETIDIEALPEAQAPSAADAATDAAAGAADEDGERAAEREGAPFVLRWGYILLPQQAPPGAEGAAAAVAPSVAGMALADARVLLSAAVLPDGSVRGRMLICPYEAFSGNFPMRGTYFFSNELFEHEATGEVTLPASLLGRRCAVYLGRSVEGILRKRGAAELARLFVGSYICIRRFRRHVEATQAPPSQPARAQSATASQRLAPTRAAAIP